MTPVHRRAFAARRLLALIALLPAALPGQATFTWTDGAMDGAWNTDGNWDQSGLPSSLDDVVVNDNGSASLADFTTTIGSASIGYLTGGSLTIGSNGSLTITNALDIGCGCASGTVIVQDGGTGSSGSLNVNANSQFTVTGQDSAWTVSGQTSVGSNAVVLVQSLGTWTTAAFTVDLAGTITVTDTGSHWAGGDGDIGTGSITLQGEATAALGAVNVAVNPGDIATLTVQGASGLTTGNLVIGQNGQGTFNVTGGSVVSTTGTARLGGSAGSIGATTVSGTSSQWTTTGTMTVGALGQGSLIVSDGGLVAVGPGGTGTLTIEPTGTVEIGEGDLSGTLAVGEVAFADSHSLGGSGSLVFNHSDGVSFNPLISGLGQVIKNGDGNLSLGGDNTYTGETIVNGGILSIAHAHALGGSTLTINDGGEARVTAPGNFTFTNAISGAGNFTHAGSGALTLGSANTYSGATSVTGGGTLILAADQATGTSEEFHVNNASTLRIESGVTLPIETLIVQDGSTVEVAGTLSQLPDAYGADITDSILHVLLGGYLMGSADYSSFGYYFLGNSTLQLDTANAIDDTAYFSFEGSSTLASTTPGAISAGTFRFVGSDPLSTDPARTLTLPGPGVITGGHFQLVGNISTNLSQTGMITGPVDLDLADKALVTISAPGAVNGTALTLGGDEDVIISLADEAVVRLEADNALVQTSFQLSDDSRFILNGHDATIKNLAADGGMIVNNSPTPVTLNLTPCGCGPNVVIANLFADSDPAYVGTAGSLSLNIDGNGDVILLGIQRHTGTTTVAGATLAIYGAEDTDLTVRGLASSPLILKNGGTLAGNGPVNTVTVQDGGGFSPGHAMLGPVNQLETGSVTLSGDTFLNLDMFDAAGAAASGWDLLLVNGTFSFSATPGDTFTVFLRSGDEGVTELLMGNFDPNASYSFTILQATGGILGFDTGLAFVDTSGFANSFNGTWSLRTSPDNQYLLLDYTAIPEPAAFAACAALAGAGFIVLRRRTV